jgi:hypothetical protein
MHAWAETENKQKQKQKQKQKEKESEWKRSLRVTKMANHTAATNDVDN